MARTAPTPAKPLPQSAEEVAPEAQEYYVLKVELKSIDTWEKDEKKRIEEEAAKRRAKIKRRHDELLDRVQTWAEANRGGRKTIKLPNGRCLKWRLPPSPALVEVGSLVAIARLFFRLDNWSDFVSVELKKNKIKADFPELCTKLRGLRRLLKVEQGKEYFSIG